MGDARRRRDARARHRPAPRRAGAGASRSRTVGCAAVGHASTGTYPADLVVLGIGVAPERRTLARDAGIAIGPTGGIATDDHQRTSADGVFAAGDCVETRHRVTGAPVAIALGTHANKQGRVVGINATGGDASFPGVHRHRGHEGLRRTRSRAPA